MKESQLNRLLRLVKKTGDKLVVLDQGTDHATVMLPLDAYEHMVDGDSLGWSGGDEPPMPSVPPDAGLELQAESFEPDAMPESSAYEAVAKEEANDEVASHGAIPEYVPGKKRLDFSENWAAENAKPLSEEDLSDVPEEEEKFYLEPVE